MPFWGSDTDQLRELAELAQGRIGTLAARRALIVSAVRSVPWEGADAEDFQELWTALASRWGSLEERARGICADLIEQAAAQDTTSSPDGATAAPASAPTPPGGGDGRAPSAETEGPSGPRPPAHYDLSYPLPYDEPGPQRAPTGADDNRKVDPDDAFSHPRDGEDHSSHTKEVEKDGNGASTTEQDGTTTHTLKGAVTTDLLPDGGKDGPADEDGPKKGIDTEVTVKSVTSGEYSERHNGDGTVTYTYTAEDKRVATEDVTVEGGRATVEAGAEQSTSDSYTKEVTVPEGTSPEKAAAMDPRDPASMPEGTTISITDDRSASQSGHAGVGPGGGTTLLDYQGTETTTDRHTTIYTKGEDGSMSIDTGDSDVVESEYAMRMGLDNANVTLGNSHTSEHGATDHVTFAPDATGQEAYREAVSSGRMPGPEADGVDERWRDTRSATSDDHSREFNLGPLSSTDEKNIHSDEIVVRDYLDGDKQYARQVQPQGDSSQDYVLERGGTDRATDYEVRMGSGNEDARDTVNDYWGAHDDDGHVTLHFTQEEADRLRTTGNGRNSSDYGSNTDYFSRISSIEHNAGGGKGFETLYHDAGPGYDDHGMPIPPRSDYTAPGIIVED